MDKQNADKKIAAIICAYNEESRIRKNLDVLTSYPHFSEIIVVNDGSTDKTGEIINKYRVTAIHHAQNKGKGASMEDGVQATHSDILFFCDADITGLTHKIIDEMLEPVLAERVDMFIAMRNRKIYFLRLLFFFVPLLGGERVVTKKIWDIVPAYYKDHFKIEAGLNFYAKYFGKGFEARVFPGIHQTIKEKKYGLLEGLHHRITMFGDIINTYYHLHTHDKRAKKK